VRSAAKEALRMKGWQAIERHAANPTLAVSCDMLCRETGVPERTLNDICRARSGLSPIAYIKRRHMSLAHAMLQRGGPNATVTGIATFCGFSSHLGRFAVRYQQCYGQSPSQTLRQPAQPVVAPRSGMILRVPEDVPLPDAHRGTPPELYWPSTEDLIRGNRALLAKAAVARALYRRVAAMAATIHAEGQRVRHHAETIGRQLHVLQPVTPPLDRWSPAQSDRGISCAIPTPDQA
jgi:AraC-like DNA-binding protein